MSKPPEDQKNAGDVVEETNSQADVTYPAMDPKVLELAYTVPVAWKGEVVQPDEIATAHAELLAKYGAEKSTPAGEEYASADDIDAICAMVADKCAQQGVPNTEIDEIKAAIKGAGKHSSRASLEAKAQQMVAAAVIEASDNLVQAQMYAKQTTAEIWAAVKEIDEKLSKNIEELHDARLISDEDYAKLKKQRAHLDAMDPNDPRRLAGEQQYDRELTRVYEKADENAPPEMKPTVEAGRELTKSRTAAINEATKRRAETDRTITSTEEKTDIAASAAKAPPASSLKGLNGASYMDVSTLTLDLPSDTTAAKPAPQAVDVARTAAMDQITTTTTFTVKDVKDSQSAQLNKPVTVASATPDKSAGGIAAG